MGFAWGVSAGPLVFPPPKRVMMGKVAAHGHHGETLFLSRYHSATNLSPLGISLFGEIYHGWHALKPVFPVFRFRAEFPLGKNDSRGQSWSAAFDAFREKLPQDPQLLTGRPVPMTRVANSNWSYPLKKEL